MQLSHRRSFFKNLCSEEILCVVVASIGVGMVLAIVLPFWWWIVFAAVSIIIYAVNRCL